MLFSFISQSPVCITGIIVCPFAGGHAGVQVFDIALYKFIIGVTQKKLHIFPLAGGEIIQAADPVTHVQNGLTEVGADESGTAGDEKKGIFGEGKFSLEHSNSFILR